MCPQLKAPVQWQGLEIVCYDKFTVCPSEINPDYLDQAATEWVCNHDPRLYCTTQCVKQQDGSVKVSWLGNQCAKLGQCPPYGYTPFSWFDAGTRRKAIADAKAKEQAFEDAVVRLADALKDSFHNVNGDAINMTTLSTNPEVAALPWLYRGKLIVKLNEHLLKSADSRGRPGTITLVTGLFDLGRGNLKDDKEFKRPFSEYVRRFRSFLAYQMPKIAFIEEKHYDEVHLVEMMKLAAAGWVVA